MLQYNVNCLNQYGMEPVESSRGTDRRDLEVISTFQYKKARKGGPECKANLKEQSLLPWWGAKMAR